VGFVVWVLWCGFCKGFHSRSQLQGRHDVVGFTVCVFQSGAQGLGFRSHPKALDFLREDCAHVNADFR
jgi:hypothetical protein